MTEQNTLSISELQQQANAGDAQAQFDLACRLAGRIEMVSSELWPKFYESLRDFLGDEDYDTATILIWLTKAAEQGLVSAQLALGLHYLRAINQDLFDKAKKSLDANKNTDSEGATLFTSLCIENGKNANLAFTWLKNAVEQNCTEAQYLLAVCYQDGIGIKQNYELAFAWFDKLAAQDFAAAQCDLARAYHEGKGVEQNNELALAWLNKAVEQTDAYIANVDLRGCLSIAERYQQYPEEYADHSKCVPEAYFLMGELYAQGKGVEQSDETACQWYQKAAEMDVADGQYRLALCYFAGKGIEKDYGLGEKWIVLAAVQGYVAAINWFIEVHISLAIPADFRDKGNLENYYQFIFNWCKKETEGYMAPEAWLMLGLLSFSGKGTEQNDAYALECFQHADEALGEALTSKDYEFFRCNESFESLIEFYSHCCDAKIHGSKNDGKHYKTAEYFLNNFKYCGRMYVDGIKAIPNKQLIQTKIVCILLQIALYKEAGAYEQAKTFIFDMDMDPNLKEFCLRDIRQHQEIIEKDKALHEKEKEMLSFFTHTMRNALATAPESLRQAIHLLGSEVYEKDTKHYQAINKIAALFSTLSLTDCLIDTFKQSISDPQEFRQSWQNDRTGDATPKWVIASALRQALNRIIFMSDTTELRKLLNNPETALIKATRKSFIEEVLPLNVDSHGVEVFYGWTLAHIPAVDVSIADSDTLNFGVNQIRFSLLFAITSELILNALKYWDGENRIQIAWQLTEQGSYVFSVKNHCKANASSNLAGTHKGLAFINRLVELLGEQAQFVCKSEGQLFTAELILTKALFDGES